MSDQWRLVPTEPTEEMLAAARPAYSSNIQASNTANRDKYQRMLAAAPTQGADARPVAEWQQRYVGDPRQKGPWERLRNIDWAELVYAEHADHAENGWQVRPLYAIRDATPTVDARPVAWKITTPEAGNTRFTESRDEMEHFAKQGHKVVEYASRDAAPSDTSDVLKQIASLCRTYIASGGGAWECGASDMAVKVLELIATSAPREET